MVKKPNFILPIHSGAKFHWEGSIGYAEISALGVSPVKRVWSDAVDTGFYVRSHKTGRTELFTWESEQHDHEGELVSTRYVSSKGWYVVLAND